MRRRCLVLMLTIFFLVGCTDVESIQPATITPTTVREATSTVVIPSDTVAGKAYVKRKICPVDRKAAFGSTSFRSKSMLVVHSNNELSLLDLTNGKSQFRQAVVERSSQFSISPDNKYVAYISRESSKRTLWTTDLKSGSPRSINLPSDASNAIWINNTRIAIWGRIDRTTCRYVLFVYDIITEKKIYPNHPLPNLSQTDCIQIPNINETGTQAVFPWSIYNFVDGKITTIPFLQNAPKDPPAYALQFLNDKIYTFYFDEDRLYYVLGTPVNRIDDPMISLNEVSLPGLATYHGWWEQASWSQNMTQIGVDLIAPGVEPIDFIISGKNIPMNYYLVKLKSNEIIDYCLNRTTSENNTASGTLENGFISPDGNYLAWTIYDKKSHQSIVSQVLDHQSGLIMSIPSVSVLGWVIP